MDARVLKFHLQIPHEKIVDPYCFSCPSHVPFLSYVPLKTKFENLVCKISQKVFLLEPSYTDWGGDHILRTTRRDPTHQIKLLK